MNMRLGQSGNLRNFVIALVVLSGVITGLLTFSSGVFNQFSTDIENSNQFDKFDTLAGETQNDTLATVSEQRNATAGISGDIASSVFVIGSVFQAMRTVFTAITNVEAIVTVFISATGLPTWLQNVIITIITVAVIFTIVSAYRAYKV